MNYVANICLKQSYWAKITHKYGIKYISGWTDFFVVEVFTLKLFHSEMAGTFHKQVKKRQETHWIIHDFFK